MNNKIGYIKYYDEFYNIKVTQQLIYKARIQVMNEITFTKETTKRKRTTTIDEEEIIQNNPNKRINNGQEFEKAVYKEMNNAGFKPIKTQAPDRGIDVIGEFRGITIYAQAKDLSGKVSAEKIQQLEGVLLNKAQSIGVMVSRNGFTKVAEDYAKGSTAKIILTDLETLIDNINRTIQTMNLYDKKPCVEISGNNIEITHEMINNNTKTTVQKAQKVIIFN